MKNTVIVNRDVLSASYTRAMIIYFSVLDKIRSGIEIVDENRYNEEALPAMPIMVCLMQSGEVTVAYDTKHGIDVFGVGYYVDSEDKFDSMRIRNWIASSDNNFYTIYHASEIGLKAAIRYHNEIAAIDNDRKNTIIMYTRI